MRLPPFKDVGAVAPSVGIHITHDIKAAHGYFVAHREGSMPFTVRKDDRPGGYRQGQNIRMCEIDAAGNCTGRQCIFCIGVVTTFEQQKGYVVFGLLPMRVGVPS